MAGFSTDILTLILARTIQGVGISMFPIAFGIVEIYSLEKKFQLGRV